MTEFDQLSPLTIDHKILFIESEVTGRNVGDDVGRIYLRQKGTGSVKGSDGRRRFYAFPERTAVLNPFFNGKRRFVQDESRIGRDRSVYRSTRFRDRPLVNSNWELLLNQQSEAVNEDINLNGITDIQLYLYYSDFTAF